MSSQTPKELLSLIKKPSDLKSFSISELKQLADEVRQAIISHVSKTGGHFASNLGVVDLTVAMYATYNMPPDKVIWDTGHQAYAHKMLTGRLDLFPTLRQYKGLSGFLRPDESEYDVFGAGHAGTAVSAALGFACARDRNKSNERIIAVVGDSAMMSGLSWEALNHAGDIGTDMTVVLNDNKMSIAESVGALSAYLSKLRARPWFQDLEHQAKQAVEKLPRPIYKMASGLKHGVTYYVSPPETGAIFDEIGFNYVGPIDGHNIEILLDVFTHARSLKGPNIIHVITTKGKGYELAETNARIWHGVGPFSIEEGKLEVKELGQTYTQAFTNALLEAAEKDPAVVAITAAMPDGTGISKFKKQFPDRAYDVGIAEEHAVTFAAGLAAGGLKPFVAIYSTFMQRAYDNIMHDVCLQNLPVKLMLDRAGLVGDDGPTHHGCFDLSFLSMMPNIVIASPKDTTELSQMVHFSAQYNDHPIAVRYPRGTSAAIDWKTDTPIEVGKAEVLREGSDIALIAVGSMAASAYEASEQLEKIGIKSTVVNARFVKPLDENLYLYLAKTIKRWIVVEENSAIGGFGHAVLALLNKNNINDVFVVHLAIPDEFIEHGSISILRNNLGLTPENIAKTAMRLMTGSEAKARVAL